MADDIIFKAPLTTSDGGGAFVPAWTGRTQYQSGETLDFLPDIDQSESASLPCSDVAPGAKRRRRRGMNTRASTKKKGGRRRKGKGRKRKGVRKGKRKTKYTVKKGKVRVYVPSANATRSFSASKIISGISARTIEMIASKLNRSKKRRR